MLGTVGKWNSLHKIKCFACTVGKWFSAKKKNKKIKGRQTGGACNLSRKE